MITNRQGEMQIRKCNLLDRFGLSTHAKSAETRRLGKSLAEFVNTLTYLKGAITDGGSRTSLETSDFCESRQWV